MLQLLRILQTSPLFSIHPEIGLQLAMYATQLLNRERQFGAQDFQVLAGSRPRAHDVRNAKGKVIGRVGTYPIHGTLLAQDTACGPLGMNTMADHMYQLANEDVDAIVLDIQSPGGQVTGTENMAEAIAYLRKEKPTIAYVNGMAASGGYRLAIETDEIMMGGKTAEVGSIGVMLHYLDPTERMKQEGYREVSIVSNYSQEKDRFVLWGDQTDEDIALIQKELLDPLALEFHQAVKARRKVDESTLTGRMFLAKNAKKLGLADSIGNFHQAIEQAALLARRRKRGQSSPTSKQQSNDMGLFNTKKEEAVEEQSQLEAMQASFDQKIAEMETSHANQLEELRAELATAQNEIASLQDQVKKLAAAPVTEVVQTDGEEEPPKADANQVVTVPAWSNPEQMEKLQQRKQQLGLK